MKIISLIITTIFLLFLGSCSFLYNNSYYEMDPLAKKIGEEILANPKIVLEIEKYYPELYDKEIYSIYVDDNYEERLDLYNSIIEFKNIDESYCIKQVNVRKLLYNVPSEDKIPNKYRTKNDSIVGVGYIKKESNRAFNVLLLKLDGKYYLYLINETWHLQSM